MRLTQVYSFGMLIIGMTIPVYIFTVSTFFKLGSINKALKILIFISLLVALAAFIVFITGTLQFMADLDLNHFLPTVLCNIIVYFTMAASDNIISILKIKAVYNHAIGIKLLYLLVIVGVLFSSVEFFLYIVLLTDNRFMIKSLVVSQKYLLVIKPWMLVHFVITAALNTTALTILYIHAQNKSFKHFFSIQYIDKFQVRVIDLVISVLFMILSITFKGIQFSTGFLPIDVFFDTFLLVWLLHVHLSQLACTKNTNTITTTTIGDNSDYKDTPIALRPAFHNP